MKHKRRLLCYPHRLLTIPAAPVDRIDRDIREEAREMLRLMEKHRGVGLAGNQVGLLKRLVVIGVIPEVIDEPLVLVNPSIIASGGWLVGEEGCLSFPGVTARVGRCEEVTATFQDLEGARLKIEARGLVARVLQHEIDHLDGIVYPRRLSLPARRLLMGRYRRERGKRSAAGTGAGPTAAKTQPPAR